MLGRSTGRGTGVGKDQKRASVGSGSADEATVIITVSITGARPA